MVSALLFSQSFIFSVAGKHIVSKTVQLGKAVIDNKKGSTEAMLTTETSLKLTQTQATVPENQCDSFTKVKKVCTHFLNYVYLINFSCHVLQYLVIIE